MIYQQGRSQGFNMGRINEWPQGGVGRNFFGIFASKWCTLVQRLLTLYIIIGFRGLQWKVWLLRMINFFCYILWEGSLTRKTTG